MPLNSGHKATDSRCAHALFSGGRTVTAACKSAGSNAALRTGRIWAYPPNGGYEFYENRVDFEKGSEVLNTRALAAITETARFRMSGV